MSATQDPTLSPSQEKAQSISNYILLAILLSFLAFPLVVMIFTPDFFKTNVNGNGNR